MKNALKYVVIALFLSSCYTSKKLHKEVRVRILNDVTVNITAENGNPYFATSKEPGYLILQFMNAFKSELADSKVILVDDETAEYNVHFIGLNVAETIDFETVRDTASPQNGISFELTTLTVECSGEVVKKSTDKTEFWAAEKDKDETLTNSRSVVELAIGGNKDNTEYREKELSSSTVGNLAGDVGRRSAVSIVKEIIKLEK